MGCAFSKGEKDTIFDILDRLGNILSRNGFPMNSYGSVVLDYYFENKMTDIKSTDPMRKLSYYVPNFFSKEREFKLVLLYDIFIVRFLYNFPDIEEQTCQELFEKRQDYKALQSYRILVNMFEEDFSIIFRIEIKNSTTNRGINIPENIKVLELKFSRNENKAEETDYASQIFDKLRRENLDIYSNKLDMKKIEEYDRLLRTSYAFDQCHWTLGFEWIDVLDRKVYIGRKFNNLEALKILKCYLMYIEDNNLLSNINSKFERPTPYKDGRIYYSAKDLIVFDINIAIGKKILQTFSFFDPKDLRKNIDINFTAIDTR
jgi:hypothetical protein